ncbi:hypothetical protein GLU64_02385 [Nanohaloarchaea archaeon]|nr:hypothetical protein [Candidatus Nanohaloarchaea archaeon]
MTQIFAFGHSVTYGKGDTEGGWTQRLDRELKNLNLENEVYNLGIPGDTTKQLLDRTEEVTRRIYSEADVLIMIQIGANDIQKVGGELRVPPGKFEENLQKIIEKAKKTDEPSSPFRRRIHHNRGFSAMGSRKESKR